MVYYGCAEGLVCTDDCRSPVFGFEPSLLRYGSIVSVKGYRLGLLVLLYFLPLHIPLQNPLSGLKKECECQRYA